MTLWNTLFDSDWLESHTGRDWHTLTKCSFGVHCRKVIMLCFLWSASMFLGCLPQCPIYVVTCEFLRCWPLLPCLYNNMITINVLYFNLEQVVSRCLLICRSDRSMSSLDLPYYSFHHYLHRSACSADVNFALLTGNLLNLGLSF